MRKSRTIKANRCYHIVSRIAHRAFFMDDEEKNRFIDLLFRAAFFSCVDLIGFCVMSNHIHIYIHLPNDRELTEDEIHARICRLYVGSRLTSDMSAISAYIDCNPVEAGICNWPTAYLWCSWTMAVGGNERARKMYEFIYGQASEDWKGIVSLHEKAIKSRIGEIEEERRNELRSGATRTAPAGVTPLEMPESYTVQLERGKNETAEKILALVREQPMSASEIGAAIGLKSRVQLITIYLKPMLERKLIEQTIPNSPRAPNQKYRLAS